MKPSGENQPQNEESLDEVNTNHLPVSLPMQNNSLPNTEVGKDSAGSGETNPSLTLENERGKSDSASPGVTHPTPKSTMKCSTLKCSNQREDRFCIYSYSFLLLLTFASS